MTKTRTYMEVVLVIALMASLGINITDEDAAENIYTCDDEQDMYCFKLSKVNSYGVQRNCYYNKESSRKYKVCSVGWEKITLQEALESETIVNSDTSQWLCSHQGCVPI